MLRLWWWIGRPVKAGVKCVLTRDGEVLLVRHTYADRCRWELPGGGIKRGERPIDAARRETREELGVDVRDWTPLGDLFERVHGKHDHLWCFTAELDRRALELDRAEIAEARWFAPGRLPPHTAKHVGRIAAMRS